MIYRILENPRGYRALTRGCYYDVVEYYDVIGECWTIEDNWSLGYNDELDEAFDEFTSKVRVIREKEV